MCVMRWARKSAIPSRLFHRAPRTTLPPPVPPPSSEINDNRWGGRNCGTWINHSVSAGFSRPGPFTLTHAASSTRDTWDGQREAESSASVRPNLPCGGRWGRHEGTSTRRLLVSHKSELKCGSSDIHTREILEYHGGHLCLVLVYHPQQLHSTSWLEYKLWMLYPRQPLGVALNLLFISGNYFHVRAVLSMSVTPHQILGKKNKKYTASYKTKIYIMIMCAEEKIQQFPESWQWYIYIKKSTCFYPKSGCPHGNDTDITKCHLHAGFRL